MSPQSAEIEKVKGRRVSVFPSNSRCLLNRSSLLWDFAGRCGQNSISTEFPSTNLLLHYSQYIGSIMSSLYIRKESEEREKTRTGVGVNVILCY